jgi:hypothetical protein
VFQFDGSDWVEQAKLTSTTPDVFDAYGWNVALSGDVAVVGAWNDSATSEDPGDGLGATYIYRFDEGAWAAEAKLAASDPAPGGFFGYQVAISGDTALIAAASDGEGPAAGLVYVKRWDGTHWIEEAKMSASDAAEGYWVSSSVALSGDLALVGAGCDDEAGPGAGAAYAFRGLSADCNENGEIDLCDIAGGFSEDCNTNSVPDECDLADGTSQDLNGNGIPDECDLPGDLDGDGDIDGDDYWILAAALPSCEGDPQYNPAADLDYDGCVTLVDYSIWLMLYHEANPPRPAPVPGPKPGSPGHLDGSGTQHETGPDGELTGAPA